MYSNLYIYHCPNDKIDKMGQFDGCLCYFQNVEKFLFKKHYAFTLLVFPFVSGNIKTFPGKMNKTEIEKI